MDETHTQQQNTQSKSKGAHPLTIDRAAFLLLRVKKAFKKKRQQRKDRLAAQQQYGSQYGSSGCNPKPVKGKPAPLLRSRTLPAIIVPGISILQNQIDPNRLNTGDAYAPSGFSSARLSLQPRSSPRVSLTCDDSPLDYRRKSSDVPSHSCLSSARNSTSSNEPYIYAFDDLERHPDGTVVLRIPAPHVVAARAYRMSSGNVSISPTTNPSGGNFFLGYQNNSSNLSSNSSGSSNLNQFGGGSGGGGGGGGGGGSIGSASSSTSNNSTGGTALYRLARLLNQSTKLQTSNTNSLPKDDAPRRLSWERRDPANSRLPRSSSIDSMVEAVWSDATSGTGSLSTTNTPRPSLTVTDDSSISIYDTASSNFLACQQQLHANYGNLLGPNIRRESLLSPSAGRRTKQHRGLNVLPNNIRLKNEERKERDIMNERTSQSCSKNGLNLSPVCSKSGLLINSRRSLIGFVGISCSDLRITKDDCHLNTKKCPNIEISLPDLVTKTNNQHQSCNNESGETQHDDLERKHIKLPNSPNRIDKLSPLFRKTFFSSSQRSYSTNGDNSIIGATYNMDFLLPQPPTSMVTSSNHHHNNNNNNGYHHKNSHNHNHNLNNNRNSLNIINHKQNGGCKISNSNLNSDSNNRNSSVITIQMAHVKNLNYHQTSNNNIYNINNNNSNNNYNNNNSDNILSIDNNNFNLNNKMSKKQLKMAQAQLNKLTQINIHLHALFSAVEHGHLEKARTILESTDVDVNSSNTDGLAPLDVAVLSNNRSMTKMLLQHGAIQGNQFKGSDTLGNHLTGLLRDAENKIQELGSSEDSPQTPFSTRASFSSIIGNTGQSVTGCTGSEIDKQLGLWERRVKGLRRMLLGWDQARPPDPPNLVTVDVTGMNNVTMRIHEPNDGPIGTKFKVQWSSRADFSNIVGEREIAEWTSQHGIMGATYRISELTQGRRYFFRANCGNVKGWGKYRTSLPTSVTPSSWRDVENREPRFLGRQRILDDLFTAVRLARPDDASDIPLETPAIQRRNPKKKTTIKQLFSAASKFQKNLRRGIYFACILYHEDKILVTNEDFIPVIEIDETYPSYLNADYHWLMKVACTWDDVKSLRTDMERNATSAVHFRTKLLSAASQMQSTLSITDLGQLYHKPLRDSHGTIVLSCVNSVKSPKSVSVLNSRWIPLNKIQKKISALHEDNTINEILMYSIADQINYHQASTIKLPKGLYLGYLKMQSSVDLIQVVVPSKTPNILPHCKIRDNPHISSEEWEFLKKKSPTPLDFRPYSSAPTEVQYLFLESLTAAAHRLFKYMDISIEEAINHRLYDIEVIELNSDVSILVICPPAESSCAVPGQREILLQRGDLLSLPIQAFEMIHLRTYQNSIIQKYSRLSCILELDTVLANHSHREAFSSTELQLAKERLAKLQELSANLNAVWKGVRWLMDVIGFARDRQCIPGIEMKKILDFNSSNYVECSSIEATDGGGDEISSSRQQLLQPPPRDTKLVKASPGRGSWPGPAVTMSGGNGILVAEHSKSDQHLSLTSNLNSRYLSATSGMENSSSRKNSGDSNYSTSGHSYYSAGDNCEHILPRLPPSRSEDTLNSAKKLNIHQASHRKRSTTMNSSLSAASSPLLNVRPASYVTATESVHSLSSDSESSSYPITTISSNSNRPKSSYIAESKSMSNVKLEVLRKPQENPLHIDENELTDCQVVLTNLQLSDRPSTSSSSTSQSTSSCASTSAATADNSTIIQVYAAYNTGLPPGTSLKLRVFTTTTAREVVDLVVKQLNMAIVLKGKDGPIYTQEKLENFCLVAVIGARERCLRDDFRPLQLQNPWIKGRLYVRQKHDLLAAIEHSNRETHLI